MRRNITPAHTAHHLQNPEIMKWDIHMNILISKLGKSYYVIESIKGIISSWEGCILQLYIHTSRHRILYGMRWWGKQNNFFKIQKKGMCFCILLCPFGSIFYYSIYGCMFCVLLFNFVSYVFLLLCQCIVIVLYVPYILFSSYQLALFGYPNCGFFSCFFLSCKANATV